MKQTYVPDFDRILDHFEAWWAGIPRKRPLMCITAPGKAVPRPIQPPRSIEDCYLDPEYIMACHREFFRCNFLMADAYPKVSADLGPGSLALYLGGQPVFTPETVWYREVLTDSSQYRSLGSDEQNPWWLRHQAMMLRLKELADGDMLVNIPDLIENADILSALRGPQEFCLDLMDEPEDVQAGLDRIDACYFHYYNRFYEMLKEPDGVSSFTAFQITGRGRVAKLQCDFSAMISPSMYRERIQPSIRRQCRMLDHSLYHLDGPDAIKHVPAIMEIPELQALQWTCGAGKPDGGCPRWYPIYDQVHDAGKSLWIQLYDGGPRDWAEKAQQLVRRYGAGRLYFVFGGFPDAASAREMDELFPE